MTAYNVLFLCTANSARSILAESLLNELGGGRFKGFSAGSFPKGEVHLQALQLLARKGYETRGLRSKSWHEFTQPGAPPLDFVVTVCDDAAREPCPVWPGGPVRTHWGIPDPAAVRGSDEQIRQAFETAYQALRDRIGGLVSLPISALERPALEERLAEIGLASR